MIFLRLNAKNLALSIDCKQHNVLVPAGFTGCSLAKGINRTELLEPLHGRNRT